MQVRYEMGGDSIPTIHSVHVLDASYKPTGPDIRDMLDQLVALTGPEEGTRVLSLVSESIHASESTGSGSQPT